MAQRAEKRRVGRHAAHIARHRLDDDRRQLLAMRGKRLLQRGNVVIRRGQRVLCISGRYAGRIRHPDGQRARTGGDQQAVAVAVVTASKLQKITASGKGAGKTNRAHRRFRPRIAHAHHLHRRHAGDDRFCQLRFRDCRRTKTQAVFRRLLHRVHNPRMRVADNRRAKRADIINITAAIHIKNISAFRAGNKTRRTADPTKSAHRRIDTAGNHLLRGQKSLLR